MAFLDHLWLGQVFCSYLFPSAEIDATRANHRIDDQSTMSGVYARPAYGPANEKDVLFC